MSTYTKVQAPTNFFSGLDAKKSHILERDCLKRLAERAKCTCGRSRSHFPKIINCIDSESTLVISNCGKSFNEIGDMSASQRAKYMEKCKDLKAQLNCIANSLKICRLRHLDMPNTGQNICMSTDGTLALIDFGVCCMDSKPIGNSIPYFVEYNGRSRAEYTKIFKKKCLDAVFNKFGKVI